MERILKKVMTTSLLCFLFAAFTIKAEAEEYVVIGKSTKVFDSANTKGYVTLNSKNEEVSLQPGMVFKTLEASNGWHVIEYSPGLRGYLSQQATSKNVQLPKAGAYTVSNAANQTINISNNNNSWTANIGSKTYKGTPFGNIVIFFNEKDQPAYSLADIGEGSVVFSYDNAATGFF